MSGYALFDLLIQSEACVGSLKNSNKAKAAKKKVEMKQHQLLSLEMTSKS